MKKYICIHGHFYQPPRENPWLEDVELQESAAPYHDWNERITSECYEPNTAARVMDNESRIIDIINNYSRISFNFGPTLLSWMKKHQVEVYNAILEADKASMERFSGHGSAVAQAYNHMIMPLANRRDKITQVIWGIKDFTSRFARAPEGMWLPETAVDMETLDILAEQGIRYTILSPRQAKRVRRMDADEKKWTDVTGERIDPRRPYRCQLPSGKSIDIFFYDGAIAQDIAFGELLKSGENLVNRLYGVLDPSPAEPQISHVATDGETYGHHQVYGDMSLAYCLSRVESDEKARLTNYGEFLETHPPSYYVEIVENSSWSCIHGVDRWKKACGCNSGMNPGWEQQWRGPLRGAMDWLRDNLATVFEESARELLKDPWSARDDYIDVVLDRSDANVDRFLEGHAVRVLDRDERIKVMNLLEMQRQSMLMYTSCGWFFDEISGIETMQVIQYAARAIQLAREINGMSFEETYVKLLGRAPSNIPEYGNGAYLYDNFIRPAMLDLMRVGAHFAISSFFEEYRRNTPIYCYNAETDMLDFKETGKQKLVVGRARITSRVTFENMEVSFSVLHLGDHNIIGGVRKYRDEKDFKATKKAVTAAFNKGDVSRTIYLIREHFEGNDYSLWHLFKDEQRKVLDQILSVPLEEIEEDMRRFKDRYYPVIKAVRYMNVPLPGAMTGFLETMFNMSFNRILEEEEIDIGKLTTLVEEARAWNIDLDRGRIAFSTGSRVNRYMESFRENPEDTEVIRKVYEILNTFEPLGLELNLWKSKNIYFFMSRTILPAKEDAAREGDDRSGEWVDLFKGLEKYFRVKVDQ